MPPNLAAAADTFRSGVAMTYTGDVEVGGPADVRELPGLTISKVAVSEMANNAYLLRDPETGEALLVDAAAEPGTLLRFIEGADVRTVVTTHGHWTTTAPCRRSSRRPARRPSPTRPTPTTCPCRSSGRCSTATR